MVKENFIAEVIQSEKYRKLLKVVAALVWKEGRFLICRRPLHKSNGGLWEFAGGKIEPTETAENALVRECKEELNITVCVHEDFSRVTHHYEDFSVELILFNAEIIEGEPQLMEHSEMRWILPEEAKDFEFCPADVPFVEKILTEYR